MSATVLAAFLLLLNTSSHAQDLFWACGDGYRWDSSPAAFCWSSTPLPPATVVVPAVGDNVFLTQSGAADITVEYYDPAAASLGNLLIEGTGAGLMTLSHVTYPHDLLASFVTVGDTGSGQVILANGTHTVSNDLILGNSAGGAGTYSVSNGAALTADWLYTGNSGTGTLAIQGGGTVSDAIGYVGYGAGSSGTVSVDGAGSRWDNSSALRIADAGIATLDITSGGTVTSLTGSLGIGSAGNGTVTVDGTGSTWTNSFNNNVGFGGTGALYIQNGGSVSNLNAFIGYLAGSSGAAMVDGAGSTWTNLGSLYVGGSATATGGTGTLTVQNGGAVDVNGTLKVWNGGSVTLEGGSITTHDFDVSAGTLNFTDGMLTIDGGVYTGTGVDLVVDGAGAGDDPVFRLINGGSTYWLGDTVVGDAGNGALVIESGGTRTNYFGIVGNSPGSNGAVTVDGAGSTWTNYSQLYVGYWGDGSLYVHNGASIVASSGANSIGYAPGSTGIVTVDGAGSTWTNSNWLHVGWQGGGALAIQNGGSVSDATGFVGNQAGSTGTVLVDGSGSEWLNTSSLYIGGNTTAAGGGGSLTVQNAGAVEVGGLLKVWGTGSLGLYDGSITTGTFDAAAGTFNFVDGTLTVDGGTYSDGNTHFVIDSTAIGANPTLTLTNVASASPSGGVYIGFNGTGTLNILSGADFTSNNGNVGSSPGSSGSVTVDGTGSTWTSSGQIDVGEDGSGSLNILNGGSVSNTIAYVGLNAGGSGAITVDGAGSTWANSSGLILGLHGAGDLVIRNGGSVSNDIATLAADPGSSATVTVEGAGSTWSNSNILVVGEDGPALLTILGGGTVTSTAGYLGRITDTGVATLDGGGSSWLNSGHLYVGDYATGILNIRNGASISNTIGHVAHVAGSSGTITVDGTGSTWINSNALLIGENGAGTLSILNGGGVTNTSGSVGAYASGVGTVTVDGAGSNWANSSFLRIGDSGSGTLTVSNGGNVSNTAGYLGYANGVSGTVTVDGPGSTWTNSTDLIVGDSGIGYLYIDNGGTVSNVSGYVGNAAGSTGQVGVYGSGSHWINSGDLEVGNAGNGTLYIFSGGSVSSDFGYVGSTAGSDGFVDVYGAGSSWISGGDLSVGYDGSGQVRITQGASVSDVGGYVGRYTGSDGTVMVSDAGSAWINSIALWIGVESDGSLLVQNGGTASSGYDARLGISAGGIGTATVNGAGSVLLVSRDLTLGVSGSGTMSILNGGSVSSIDGTLGQNMGSSGTMTLSGTGSNWNSSGNLYLGHSGTADLEIRNGGSISSTNGYLGYSSNSSAGTVLVDGAGSIWNNTGDLYIGGNSGVAHGSGDLTVQNGGILDVAGLLKIWSTGSVTLSGGTITAGDLDGNNGFTFSSGSLSTGADLGIGSSGPLGSDLTLTAVHSLSVGGATTIDPFSTITLDGGSFSTGSLLNNGVFDFRRGTFSLTNADLAIGSGGLFGSAVPFGYGQAVNVTQNVSIDPGAVLTLRGGTLTAGQVTNNGLIEVTDVLSDLSGGGLLNNGVLRGDGRISAPLANSGTGEVRADAGKTLVFQGAGNTNAGRLTLLGGTLDFSQGMSNTGQVSGHGTLITGPLAILTNTGAMAFTGNTDLIGDVDNAGGGSIIISGSATTTFHDDVTHNGSEIRVSSGSQAVFFGAVSGSGPYTGTGTVFFEGDLNPGSSPGLVSVQGDMGLGIGSHTIMEVAGLGRGTEYDAFDIGGSLALGGTLEVSLYDAGSGLFAPQLGDSFDLFLADTITGDFNLLTLATLGGGLGWQLDVLSDAIGLADVVRLSVVASAVPVPPALWLFATGLLGLIAIARRRTAGCRA